jgi:hypothetical protein
MNVDQVRRFALSLPEVTEEPHFHYSSFRVRGKIFATVPDEEHLRVMADEGEIRACVAQDPAAFAELWWGSRLSCVVVDLAAVDGDQLSELLADAWRRTAPGALGRAHDAAT